MTDPEILLLAAQSGEATQLLAKYGATSQALPKHAHLPQIFYLADLFSTFIFAYCGSRIADLRKAGLSIIVLSGFLTAFGGGTLRCIFLDHPFIWMSRADYLLACTAGIVVFMICRFADAKPSEKTWLQRIAWH